MTKKQRIIDHFTKNPDADIKKAAAKFNAALPTIYMLRKVARIAAVEGSTPEEVEVAVDFSNDPQIATPVLPADARQVGGNHYKAMGVQPWQVVDTWPREQRIGYYRGGALKYLMRMGSKDMSAVEIAKGQHYMQKLLEVLNEQE